MELKRRSIPKIKKRVLQKRLGRELKNDKNEDGAFKGGKELYQARGREKEAVYLPGDTEGVESSSHCRDQELCELGQKEK